MRTALAKRRASSWATRDRVPRWTRCGAWPASASYADSPHANRRGGDARRGTGYKIEKLVIQPGGGHRACPHCSSSLTSRSPVTRLLYLHEKGKAADAGPGGPIQRRVLAGETILAPDLRGTGQTEEPVAGYFFSRIQTSTPPICWAAPMWGCGRKTSWSCSLCGWPRRRAHQPAVRLVAIGSAGIPALHAAALEPQLFSAVRLSHTLASWATILRRRVGATNEIVNVVHGALVHYDLPDLATVLGDKLTIEQPDGAAAGPGGECSTQEIESRGKTNCGGGLGQRTRIKRICPCLLSSSACS